MSEPPRPWWAAPRPWLLQLGLPLLAAAALVLALLWAGGWSRGWLRAEGAARVPFAELECAAPPGLTREAFLGEVQFGANLPDEVDVLDPEAAGRVRAALLAHPWVKSVGAVELRRGVMTAGVTFREPVLLVKAWGRAIDAGGHVLPRGAETAGLFVLGQAMKGRAVDDDGTAAAAVAGALHPHREKFGLVGAAVSVEKGEVEVRAGGTLILWGPPEGAEGKLRRLLEGGPVAGRTWDLRGEGR